MKLIVTGGLGFIGSNYISKIIKNKAIKIYNFDFENYASNEDQLKNFKKYKNFVHKKIKQHKKIVNSYAVSLPQQHFIRIVPNETLFKE